MRKLIVSMNITQDGFLSGLHCEMDWHFRYWSVEMGKALCLELQKADTVVMGRVTFDVFRRFATQPQSVLEIQRDMYPFFDMLNRYQKIVFSKTVKSPGWANTLLFADGLVAEIDRLKKAPGSNLMLYGSAGLLRSLQKHNLVDEYQLWVHPVKLIEGKPLFVNGQMPGMIQTGAMQLFPNGVVLSHYRLNNRETLPTKAANF